MPFFCPSNHPGAAGLRRGTNVIPFWYHRVQHQLGQPPFSHLRQRTCDMPPFQHLRPAEFTHLRCARRASLGQRPGPSPATVLIARPLPLTDLCFFSVKPRLAQPALGVARRPSRASGLSPSPTSGDLQLAPRGRAHINLCVRHIN